MEELQWQALSEMLAKIGMVSLQHYIHQVKIIETNQLSKICAFSSYSLQYSV